MIDERSVRLSRKDMEVDTGIALAKKKETVPAVKMKKDINIGIIHFFITNLKLLLTLIYSRSVLLINQVVLSLLYRGKLHQIPF